jgi:hypothetical protein
MKIVIEKDSIAKINMLLNLCPDTFPFVPLKFYIDFDNGNSYASIETVDINGDVIFSGRVTIDPLELQPGTGMVVRLPMNKTIINTIFGSAFDKLEISKNKINAKAKNKNISVAMYQLSEDDILEFPYDNISIFNLAVQENKLGTVEYCKFEVEPKELRDLLDCIDILSSPEFVIFSADSGGKLSVGCDDHSGNEVEYEFETISNSDFLAKYDMNLVKIMNKVSRTKDFKVDVLISNILAAFTLEKDDSQITIAVTAQKL